jgi:hypothetical protein
MFLARVSSVFAIQPSMKEKVVFPVRDGKFNCKDWAVI